MASDNASREVMKLWAQSWESYLKTLQAVQDQGDKMMELMIGQNPLVPEDAKKMFHDWTANGRKIQQIYLDLIEQNLRKAEDSLKNK